MLRFPDDSSFWDTQTHSIAVQNEIWADFRHPMNLCGLRPQESAPLEKMGFHGLDIFGFGLQGRILTSLFQALLEFEKRFRDFGRVEKRIVRWTGGPENLTGKPEICCSQISHSYGGL
jgi:hypothetical protein